jgi:hypothetical protein
MATSELRADYSWLQLSDDHDSITKSRSLRSGSSPAKFNQSQKKTESHHEFLSEHVEDTIRGPSTKRIAKVVSLHTEIFFAVVSTIVALLLTGIGPGKSVNIQGSWRPDGTFRYLQTYNPWATSGLFQITLGFGTMSFSNADLIAVIWDVVVVRGGSLLPLLPRDADANFSRPMDSGLHYVLGIYEVISTHHGAETSTLQDLRSHHFWQLYQGLPLAADQGLRQEWQSTSESSNHMDDDCFVIRSRISYTDVSRGWLCCQ